MAPNFFIEFLLSFPSAGQSAQPVHRGLISFNFQFLISIFQPLFISQRNHGSTDDALRRWYETGQSRSGNQQQDHAQEDQRIE